MRKGKAVKATPMPDLRQSFSPSLLGKAVASKRTNLGLRIIDIAEILGISKQTVAKIEAGDPSVKFSNLLRVLEYLGLSLVVKSDFQPIKLDQQVEDDWF